MPPTTTAVLLVAGIGSRLRPLTDDRPKALVEVGGVPLLLRAVETLRSVGVSRLVLATGYREQAVRSALSGCGLQVEFCVNPAFDRTQNSVSLALCKAAVGGASFFKLDGDVLFRPEVLERLLRSQASLAVAVDGRRTLDAEAMKVRVENSRISAFGKGLTVGESYGESIGIERIGSEAVAPLFASLEARIAAGEDQLYYEDVYSEMIGRGQLVAEAVEVGDLPWTEIDNHEDLRHAEALAVGGAFLPTR